MLYYRCYVLDDADRITSFTELVCCSNEDAIEEAKRYAKLIGKRVEVWRGREMIYCDRR